MEYGQLANYLSIESINWEYEIHVVVVASKSGLTYNVCAAHEQLKFLDRHFYKI